jgi:hypothetical protein
LGKCLHRLCILKDILIGRFGDIRENVQAEGEEVLWDILWYDASAEFG